MAFSSRSRSGGGAPPIHTQRVATVATTLSVRSARASCASSSVARLSRTESESGRSLQTIAAVWFWSRLYPSRLAARCLPIDAPAKISSTVSRRSAWVPRVSSSLSLCICSVTAALVSSMNEKSDRAETASSCWSSSVGGESEGQRHPALPEDALQDAIGAQCRWGEPTAQQIMSEAQRFRADGGGDRRAGIANVGRDPVQHIGGDAPPQPRRQDGICGDLFHVGRREDRLVELVQPRLWVVENRRGAL